MKYPEINSKFILSLPVSHLACIAFSYLSIMAILIAAGTEYIYYGEVKVSPTQDNLYGIFAIVSFIGGMLVLISTIILLYQTFNFPKCKPILLKRLAMTGTITTSIISLAGVCIFAVLSEYTLIVVFVLFWAVVIYLHSHYGSSVTALYNNKYSSSIQSVVVTSLKQLAPDKTELTKRCPYCGEEILAVAKKCKHCGEWLTETDELKEYIKCPICGEQIEKGTDICPHCNEPIKNE